MKNAIQVRCRALISGFFHLNSSRTSITTPPTEILFHSKPVRTSGVKDHDRALRVTDKIGADAAEPHLFYDSAAPLADNKYVRLFLIHRLKQHLPRVSVGQNNIDITAAPGQPVGNLFEKLAALFALLFKKLLVDHARVSRPFDH